MSAAGCQCPRDISAHNAPLWEHGCGDTDTPRPAPAKRISYEGTWLSDAIGLHRDTCNDQNPHNKDFNLSRIHNDRISLYINIGDANLVWRKQINGGKISAFLP